MSCALCFWLFGLGSLLTGALLSWIFTRNQSDTLRREIDTQKRKVHHLEEEYAALRTSNQSEVMSLKSKNRELQSSLAALPMDTRVDDDIKYKYEALKAEYDQLLAAPVTVSEDADSISTKDYEKLKVNLDKALEENKDLSAQIDILKIETGKDLEVNKIKKGKGKGKKKKKIKKLEKQVARLKKKLKKEEKVDGIKKEVEINKSLRLNKLVEWLKSDKAYKVKKKVSTKKLKN